MPDPRLDDATVEAIAARTSLTQDAIRVVASFLPDPRPTEAEVQEAHLRETHCPAWKWQMDLLRRAGCFRPEPVPTTEDPRG